MQKICYIATFNINTLKIKCACLAFPLDNNDNNRRQQKIHKYLLLLYVQTSHNFKSQFKASLSDHYVHI